MVQETQTILPNGTIIHNRYAVEDLLGKGGFGAVYLVGDQRVKNNHFALKEIIDPDARTRKNFTVECELLRRLDHPALPRFYSVFEDNRTSRIYLLMDYVAGQNLDILRQRQPKKRFSLAYALRLMEPIMDAVSYIHQCEPPIIHRDIKPANIIVSASKDDTVLVDFGIAKEYNQDATTTAVRRLSPHYSAPEQYTFGTNLSTDIYGLAATLYVMLSGVVPVDAFHRVIQLRTKGVDPLEPLVSQVPHFSPEVSTVIERAMAIHPEDRFASVQKFWQALQTTASGGKAELLPVSSALLVSNLDQQASEQASSLLPVSDIAASDTAPASDIAASDTAPASDTTPTTTTIIETHDPPLRTTIPDEPAETPILSGSKADTRTNHATSRRRIPLLLGMIALLALVAGILYGTGELPIDGSGFLVSGAHQPGRSTQTPHVSAPTATVKVIVTPTQMAKPSPTPTAVQHPTSTVAPFVTGSRYTGSVDDQSAEIQGDLTFTNVQQQGNTFKGTLTFSNGLSGQANFDGTMTADKKFTFIVTPYTQNLPLLFNGIVNANGSMSGTYCSERNNSCDYSSGGYGTWQMTPE